MTITKTYSGRAFDPLTLVAELESAGAIGVSVASGGDLGADTVTVHVESAIDEQAIDAVVAAHDATTRATSHRAHALAMLRAQRDRWLAQTDVLVLPESSLPVDFPQARKDEILTHQQAWLDFRQALRDYPASVVDPLDPPPFPAQPAAPSLILS